MAINALKKITPSWYTPDGEKESDNPTRFRLRPLTPSQREECMRYDGETGFHIPPSQYKRILGYGVADWENLLDESGHAIPFTPANMERLPGDLRMELALELLMQSQLGEAETKNS